MSRCWECECDYHIDRYDVDDLLDEINDRLRKEGWTSHRKLIAVDDLAAIREAIKRGDASEATWLFDQAIFPKWKEIRECEKALKEVRKPPPPPPKEGLWMYAECG